MTELSPTRNLDNADGLPASGNNTDVTLSQRTLQNAQHPRPAEEQPRPTTTSPLIGLLTITSLFLPMTIVPFFLVRRRHTLTVRGNVKIQEHDYAAQHSVPWPHVRRSHNEHIHPDAAL